MPSGITLHVDGSRVVAADGKSQALGWAVVACYQDQLIERFGAQVLPINKPAGGYHEQHAFAHAALLVNELDVPLKDATLICDDEIFGFAPTWLHPENYIGNQREKVLHRLDYLVRLFFDEAVKPLILNVFAQCRVVKVKGHRFHVYQERTDYLAKHAARTALGLKETPPKDFDSWLQRGWLSYTSPDEPPSRVYAAFAGPPEVPTSP